MMLDFKNRILAYHKARKEKLIANGKYPWFSSDKIEKQTIINALTQANVYIRGVVLDVGCGEKPYYEYLHKIARVEYYIGLDLPPNTFNKSKDSKIKADVFGDALNLPFRSNSFDTVISTQVLEHIPEPKRMLGEIYRVLKRGGYLILTCPLIWNIHDEPHDYFRYTLYGLEHLSRQVGFDIVTIRPRAGKWGTIGQLLCNAIYFGKRKNLIIELIKVSICCVISLLFSMLDRIDWDEKLTLGYLLIAKKP